MFVPPRRLRLYSDKNYVPNGKTHVTILAPFWGKQPEAFDTIYHRRFEKYLSVGTSIFEMTSLEEADIAVMPTDWDTVVNDSDLCTRFAHKVQQAGKQIVVFNWGSSFAHIPIENGIIFRNSMLRSTRKPTEFSLPYWSEDFVEEYLDGKLPIRQKRDKPTVGFCGFAEPLKPTPKQRLINTVRKGRAVLTGKMGQKAAGVFGRAMRTQALQILDRSANVNANIVIRDRFWAGAVSPNGSSNPQLLKQARLEYLHNMVDSDYNLVLRGAGNGSFRLFETLSCARIPVFVDTDCVVPYDFAVDWKKYCVWVDQADLPYIADKIAEFHSKLSPMDFVDLQQECRKFWREWLSPEGFFAHFYLHLEVPEVASRLNQQHQL